MQSRWHIGRCIAVNRTELLDAADAAGKPTPNAVWLSNKQTG
jgi:hypothetical protein